MQTFEKFNHEILDVGGRYMLVSMAVTRLVEFLKIPEGKVWELAMYKSKTLQTTVLGGLQQLFRETFTKT